MTNKPQLTISLLISDRLDTIPRCLDSLRPLMDAVSCELILINTSTNPAVHNLLLEYTDQVYEFEWCHDFSKARNEGLKRANGEWFLYLDDDEWFEDTKEIIAFFQTGEYLKYGYATYIQRNYLDDKYIHYTDDWVTRMIKIQDGLHFVSKIHEYFSMINGDRKDLYTIANHTGYIYSTPDKKRAHFERNHVLLLDMIKEEPHNLRWRLQLAQEYSTIDEWEKLIVCCQEGLDLIADVDTDEVCNHMATFYVGMVDAYFFQKKYVESVEVCKKALGDSRCKVVLRAMMCLKIAENYLHLEMWDDAIERVEEYLHILERVDRTDKKIREQEHALLAGDVFESIRQKVAYGVLICAHLEKGNIKALVENYENLGWHQEVAFGIGDIEKYMVKAMWSMEYNPIFSQVLMDVLCNRNLRVLFCKEILRQSPRVANNFQRVIYEFSDTYKRVLDGPQEGDLLLYQEMLSRYIQYTCQWYDFLEIQGMLGVSSETEPCYMQAAIILNDYFELETQNKLQALGCLRDVVEVMPEFAEGIGEFIQHYNDLEMQRVKKQQDEMEVLRVQVLAQVKGMLVEGQTEAARQIIGQLKQMLPGDVEVSALASEVGINQ